MSDQDNLYVRLQRVAQKIDHVDKKGRNDFHKYDYTRAADVFAALRGLLLDEQLIVIPNATSIQQEDSLTTVRLNYRFVATDLDEAVDVKWIAVGQDKGDKGIYKAYTSGLKSLLLSLFLLPSGDDVEQDSSTASERGVKLQAELKKRKIPQDRIKLALAASGVEVGKRQLTTVFKQLSDQEVNAVWTALNLA